MSSESEKINSKDIHFQAELPNETNAANSKQKEQSESLEGLLSYQPDTEVPENITAENAKKFKWYSSNSAVGEKQTPDGKKIYGLSLTTNAEYAQRYSKNKRVNVFGLNDVKLKDVSFNYGMTIDGEKLVQLLTEGYDGVIFDGMAGPEIALLKDVAKLEGQTLPIPKGFQILIERHRPISVTIDEYGIRLPEGYMREGDKYVWKAGEEA